MNPNAEHFKNNEWFSMGDDNEANSKAKMLILQSLWETTPKIISLVCTCVAYYVICDLAVLKYYY